MSYLAKHIAALDERLADYREQCGALALDHQSWLEETVVTNKKRLAYQTTPSLECPRSHRRPAPRGRRRPLAAVKEGAEDKENVVASDTGKGSKRALGMRSANSAPAGDENVGSKRKSESSIDECDSKRAREDEEEVKQATTETSRDQLAEICAASAALKKVEEEARATFAKLTVPSLRSECTRLGLPTDGLKPALVARLVGHQAASKGEGEGEGEGEAAAGSGDAAAGDAAAGDAAAGEEGPREGGAEAAGKEEEEEEGPDAALERLVKLRVLLERLQQHHEARKAGGAGKLNPAAFFGAALDAESTALFENVGSFEEAEARAADEADSMQVDGSASGDEPPEGGLQRMMEWAAKPFLSAPASEAASEASASEQRAGEEQRPGEEQRSGEEGYTVCDELEKKLEVARSVRKPSRRASEASSTADAPAAGGGEAAAEEPAADAAPASADDTGDDAAAEAAPASASALPAEAPAAAEVEEAAEAEAEAAAEEVAEEAASAAANPFVTAEEPAAESEPAEAASAEAASAAVVAAAPAAAGAAAAASQSSVAPKAAAASKAAAAGPKLKPEDRFAKAQKKKEEEAAERKAKQEEVRKRREKQEEERQRALAEKMRLKDEKEGEERREAKRKELEEKRKADARKQAQTAPAAKPKPAVKPAVAVEGVVGPASSATAGPTAAGPAKPALPPLSAGWTEHKTPEGRPYYYHAATKKSTWERPGAARPGADDAAKQYSIPEDRASSGDESESEEEDAPAKKQLIPNWAQSSQLQPALIEQYTMDPDNVFETALHEQTTVVDLGSIFGRSDQNRRGHRRASSGDWSRDQLLQEEVAQYKKARGLQG
ncbi:hypothetical protein EMIHUDRAFT_108042 [Emiliania huxleyi CCMP1516]|uniref:SAP domain-containing protein n=2 Tax=Emiliania huxleyi TaxID=2903 RepID=A0A0D3HY46_EMIH1|nr:hypothetical protein EMIHUDRAFT_108042 [Emiliania huxleyi CCMP1516]EOD03931.1 hypothetical protein EMIHUDRAFT_108042 [Emiliania huxleyi CCMP1516]|eukprot:XP_005756360.1 hypothetical protein EMIHUDRAFT_108042 [Emiliania huxleyi CCMP1516]